MPGMKDEHEAAWHVTIRRKKKGEGGQQREQKLLQQKRVASPRVSLPVGLVYYLFVVCVVLSCIENNNASRGQTILGYSPGLLLYSKCPCLVLLPISCRPRSTTANMTSSTQLSVRFPPSKIEAGPPIERSVCVPNCHFRQNRNLDDPIRPSFLYFFILFFFYSFFVYYYLLFPFGFMLPRTTFPHLLLFCVRVGLPCLVYAKWGRLEKKIVPWTTHSNCFGCTLNGPTNQTTLSDRAFRRSSSTHIWTQEGRLASILTTTSLYYMSNCS